MKKIKLLENGKRMGIEKFDDIMLDLLIENENLDTSDYIDHDMTSEVEIYSKEETILNFFKNNNVKWEVL